MTRRWTSVPGSGDVPVTPIEGCCGDAETVQEWLEDLSLAGTMISLKVVDGIVMKVCRIIEYEDDEIIYLTEEVQ